jgi:hypothetical protein
VTDENENGD